MARSLPSECWSINLLPSFFHFLLWLGSSQRKFWDKVKESGKDNSFGRSPRKHEWVGGKNKIKTEEITIRGYVTKIIVDWGCMPVRPLRGKEDVSQNVHRQGWRLGLLVKGCQGYDLSHMCRLYLPAGQADSSDLKRSWDRKWKEAACWLRWGTISVNLSSLELSLIQPPMQDLKSEVGRGDVMWSIKSTCYTALL